MSHPSPRSSKRIGVFGKCSGLLLFVALLVVGYLVWAARGTSGVAAQRRELRDRGLPGSMEELEGRRLAGQGNPSRLDRLLLLARAGIGASPGLEGQLGKDPPAMSVPASRRREIREGLRGLTRLPAGLWSIAESNQIPMMRDSMLLTREVSWMADEAVGRGERSEAAECALDLLAIAEAFEAEPGMVALILRNRALESAVLGVLPKLAGVSVESVPWAVIQDRLARTEDVPALEMADLPELLGTLDVVEAVSNGFWKPPTAEWNVLGKGWKHFGPLLRTPAIARRLLEHQVALFQSARLPYPECIQDRDALWNRRLRQIPNSDEKALGIGVIMSRAEMVSAIGVLAARMGSALCAAERYRIREAGRIPARMEDLAVPGAGFLQQIPRDPFSGQPLILELIESGYRIRRPPGEAPGVSREFVEGSLVSWELRVLR